MDTRVTDKLSADSLAHTLIITILCRNLVKISPEIAACVRESLNEAARKTDDIAIQLGVSARPEFTIEAMRVVEQIRTGVLGSKG